MITFNALQPNPYNGETYSVNKNPGLEPEIGLYKLECSYRADQREMV